MNQSVKFWSKDISSMRLLPNFGKSENCANFCFVKNWKIFEFTLVQPGPKTKFVYWLLQKLS